MGLQRVGHNWATELNCARQMGIWSSIWYCPSFNYFRCDHLKYFIEFVKILLQFYVLVFWSRGMWDLSSLSRDQTCTPYIGRRFLTTGLTGKSHRPSFIYLFIYFRPSFKRVEVLVGRGYISKPVCNSIWFIMEHLLSAWHYTSAGDIAVNKIRSW